MYCAQINSLTYSLLTQNYRNTGKQNNGNGTIIFPVPVVMKFNYRRKKCILSTCHIGQNVVVAAHMLKVKSGDTCSGLCAAPAVTCPLLNTDSQADRGMATGWLHSTTGSLQSGFNWNKNTCLCRWYCWRNPWSWTFNFEGVLMKLF